MLCSPKFKRGLCRDVRAFHLLYLDQEECPLVEISMPALCVHVGRKDRLYASALVTQPSVGTVTPPLPTLRSNQPSWLSFADLKLQLRRWSLLHFPHRLQMRREGRNLGMVWYRSPRNISAEKCDWSTLYRMQGKGNLCVPPLV
jgi:hypothetical protein